MASALGAPAPRRHPFIAARTLDSYPVGRHRWALLGLTVMATILAAYEFNLAPLLPLLLPYLHMSKVTYGYFITFAVLTSGVAAFYGGPLADRYGRVVLIDACLACTTLLTFLNIAVTGIWSFVLVRTLMGMVGGLMAGAGAALVRDMSPRLSRAMAFGLLTIGPVGSNWLVNFIAGQTLPIFHTWQSQFWIMGTLGTLIYVPILLWLKDLSPELRLKIFASERATIERASEQRPVHEIPHSNREAFAMVLRHYEVWAMVFGVNAFLMIYVVIQSFGPLMFTEAFHYSSAAAAEVNAYFWLFNLLMLVVVGFSSDRLQLRKPFTVLGALLTLGLMAWWIPTFGHGLSRATTIVVASALGGFLAIGYVPWAAEFSETLEDISPALQATGWAFFGLVARGWIAISAPLMLYVASRSGWDHWMWVCLGGVAIYALVMCSVRGRWLPAASALAPAPPQPAARLSAD